ncbi:hypothetical protein DVB69_00750 [Sporosarcina sp. BI001-red]|uniref:hypothetical protein n=1 Tax=Sporosarcina sp. BI001-red TaxID=2282866 RepID=UPI000E288F4D|nr:hypothetical protein [Sporosarcina sp. BI001-red]REB11474.1 hypothetical protein DVB69_00750 [Sporosarcina sp. BI001-red]
MDNNTIKKIAHDEIKADDVQMQLVIDLGKQKINQNHLLRYSLFNLFCSSLRFTRIRTWLTQFSLLLLTAFFITKMISKEPSVLIIQCVTIAIIFSAFFFINELFQSFTTGMWELEQTLKYDLRQHTMTKLLIFGVADLCLILCLALICQGVVSIPFWQIILYLLVPFNITCIVLFSLFTIWRNNLTSFIFWIGSGLIVMGTVILINAFNVYELGVAYWGIAFTLSTVFLGAIVMEMMKTKKWEAYY